MRFSSWLQSVRSSLKSRGSRRSVQALPQMESLEQRTLLTVTALLLQGNVLSVTSDSNDAITVQANPSDQTKVQVLDDGVAVASVASLNCPRNMSWRNVGP